jgi:LmbE family N-acetylglucosaminyl deacetylase
MQLFMDSSLIFIPDNEPVESALSRTTHMGIGAHQDDLEIMALHGILECFQQEDKWFCGVTMTDGRGSPRDALYKDFSDEEMRIVRRGEQNKAAVIGEYSAQIQLDYPSAFVKGENKAAVISDLINLITAAKPTVIYTHNLADKHDTHVGVTLRVIEALRQMEPTNHPRNVYGCEVWRDLDWMIDEDKITFDVSAHENLQAALLGVFDSQISGGKRYDLASMGRRRANATYFASHGTDLVTGMVYGIDLTPLVKNPDLDIKGFLDGFVQRTSEDIQTRLERLQVAS